MYGEMHVFIYLSQSILELLIHVSFEDLSSCMHVLLTSVYQYVLYMDVDATTRLELFRERIHELSLIVQ